MADAVTWTLVDSEKAEEDTLSGVLILTDPDGKRSITLFTNEELAERFAQQVPKPNIVTVRLESTESLQEWLPEVFKDGVEYVSVNPVTRPDQHSERHHIPDLLADIARNSLTPGVSDES